MRKLIILIVLFVVPMVVIAQTSTENYVKTTSFQVETQNGSTDLQNVPLTNDDRLETITYFDGIGRAKQSINRQGGAERQNIVVHMEYDALGLQTQEYLPWATAGEVSNSQALNYLDPVLLKSDIGVFYNTLKYDNTLNPYSETRFENVPSGRPSEQAAPGNHWVIDHNSNSDRTIKLQYKVNDTSEVLRFYVGFNGGNLDQPYLILNGFHPQGSLVKTVTKDENWQESDGDGKTTQEFTNKLGQVVLKRTFNTVSGPYQFSTYYVYDDYGNLTYVLSPEASHNIIENGGLAYNHHTILNELGYQYVYDDRNRMVEKKLPGKDWEHIVYDNLDRPILTQDALQRVDGEWLFTKYDAFGRVAYTGVFNNNATRITHQGLANNTGSTWESRTQNPSSINNTNVYYTHASYPTNATQLDVLTVSYYDDYVDSGNLSVPPTVMGVNTTNDLKGLPTVSRVRVLGTSDWIVSITGYDDRGRAIYTASENNYLDTTDEVESLLDFTGKPLETAITHTRGTNDPIVTNDYFTYDHAGRLLAHKQKIEDESVQLIAENVYDELGQLVMKNVGGETVADGLTDITNADVNSLGTVSKNIGTDAWDAGAKTRGELTGDGGISFVVPNSGSRHYKVGLVDVGGSNNAGWGDFDFAIYIRAGDTNGDGQGPDVDLVIGNAVAPAHEGITTYAQGDIFSVERVGSDIKFKKGDTVLLSTVFDDTTLLTGKAGMYTHNTVIDDLELSGSIDAILQNVDYAYNVRGWLAAINDVSQIFDGKTTDLFNFKVNYTSVEESLSAPTPDAVPLYNGNIAQTIWKNKFGDQEKRAYAYAYDDLNRIRKASSRKGGGLENKDSFSLWNVNYDRNGNIETLRRSGEFANQYWDDLDYNNVVVNGVTTNRLQNVIDGVFDPQCQGGGCSGYEEGFVDGNDHTVTWQNDYEYDVNGNMTVDRNKGVESISYNHLNLPVTVDFGSNGQIDYIYDATGVKQKKLLTVGSSVTTTDYAGNYMYLDDNLEFFNHPEGYIMVVAGTGGETKGFKGGETTTTEFEYVFQYKDHLGNIRLSYSDADQNGSIIESEIIEESNYFPFGLKQWGYNTTNVGGNDLAQQWKYQGQELTNDLEFNMYEFKWRMHDPATGRFIQIDPLAEDYVYNSTYAFAENRVIDGFELEGLEHVSIHTRSFAPFKSFGPGKNWAGDNRGFSTSTDKKTTSRLSMITSYDLSTKDYSTEYSGSVSFMYAGIGSTRAGQPLLAYSEPDQTSTSGNGEIINLRLSGNDDAVIHGLDGTALEDFQSPDINLNQLLQISFDQETNILQIGGNLSGDGFPNAESFIEDSNGNKVFLTTFSTKWGAQSGPTFALWSTKNTNRDMGSYFLNIQLDENGNFQSVIAPQQGWEGTTYSIEEWNQRFINQND